MVCGLDHSGSQPFNYRKEHVEFYVATPYALANAQMVHAHVHTVRDIYRITSK